MRVSFNPGNAKSFREFFNQDVDFLDVYLTHDRVYVISNRPDTYSHKVFEVLSRENFVQPLGFRVDRKEFLSLLSEGVVTVFIGPNKTVELTFKSDRTFITMTRPLQASDLMSISSKFDILRKFDKFIPIKLKSLNKLMSLIRSFTSVVNIRNGVLFASEDNVSMFCKVDCEDLSLLTTSANHILRFSNKVYGYQNYIIGVGEDVVMIAKQSRSDMESDFDYVLSRKSSHSITADFTSPCMLARKCNNASSVVVDFDSELFSMTAENLKYRTKFEVKELVSVKDSKQSIDLDTLDLSSSSVVTLSEVKKAPKLMFPVKLFRDLLTSVERTNVRILIKKRFVLFEVNDSVYFVVGRREDV